MVSSSHNTSICLELSQNLPAGIDKTLETVSEGPVTCQPTNRYLMNTPVIITATYLLLHLYSLSHKCNTILWCVCRHRSWFQWFKIFSRRPNFFVMMGKKSIIILSIFDTSEKTSENKNSSSSSSSSNNNNNNNNSLMSKCMANYGTSTLSQREWTRLQENILLVKLQHNNQKNLHPQLNCYRDNCKRNSKELELFYLTDYQIHIMTFRRL